jgi:hypothetical protein
MQPFRKAECRTRCMFTLPRRLRSGYFAQPDRSSRVQFFELMVIWKSGAAAKIFRANPNILWPLLVVPFSRFTANRKIKPAIKVRGRFQNLFTRIRPKPVDSNNESFCHNYLLIDNIDKALPHN